MCYLFAQILIYVSVLALPQCPLFNLWKVIFCHIIASAHSQTNSPSHKNTRHNKPYIHTKCNHNTISFVPFKQRYRNLLEELQISSRPRGSQLLFIIHHFKIYFVPFSFAIMMLFPSLDHDSQFLISLHPQQCRTTSQLIHTGDVRFG